jgi:hypothetical protein
MTPFDVHSSRVSRVLLSLGRLNDLEEIEPEVICAESSDMSVPETSPESW